jgi:hypothetical protein
MKAEGFLSETPRVEERNAGVASCFEVALALKR